MITLCWEEKEILRQEVEKVIYRTIESLSGPYLAEQDIRAEDSNYTKLLEDLYESGCKHIRNTI